METKKPFVSISGEGEKVTKRSSTPSLLNNETIIRFIIQQRRRRTFCFPAPLLLNDEMNELFVSGFSSRGEEQ